MGTDKLALLASLSSNQMGPLGASLGGLMGAKSNSDLFAGILASNTVEDRLIERFGLKKVYGLTYQEDLRTRLSNNTDIVADRKTGIISITVRDRSAQRAADLANGYVQELNVLSTQLSTSSARREREFLEGRLKEVSEDLEEAERDFSQFASKNATLNIQEQGKAMVEAAAELEGRLIAAQAQLEGLRAIYTDNNARVAAVKAQIGELQKQLQKMGGKPGLAQSPVGDEQLYPSIRQLPLLGVPWADLYRKLKVQEATYEVLTKQYELAKVEEAKEIPSVKVLDFGELPQKKSFPPRTLITALGTLFSFLFGCVFVVTSVKWSSISPDDPGKAFVLQVWTETADWIGKKADENRWVNKLKETLTKTKPADNEPKS
jgi:capsule polysaccharide export protein KpsE/RkpR